MLKTSILEKKFSIAVALLARAEQPLKTPKTLHGKTENTAKLIEIAFSPLS